MALLSKYNYYFYQTPTSFCNTTAGTVRVPAAQSLSDEEQLAMNWYVEGVQGQLPQ